MRPFDRILIVAIGCLAAAPTRSLAFDTDAYIQFLESVRDQTADELIGEYAPFGPYVFEVPGAPGDPEYLDAIRTHFALTDGEQGLLDLHGFVVSERLSRPSYGAAFEEIWHADLPVFVSTDAILHAVHRSYVDILAAVEREYLRVLLADALEAMHVAWDGVNDAYGATPGMRASLDDIDVYLTVARSLLAGAPVAPRGDNQATVDDLLALCDAEQPAWVPLFNEVPRYVDFSQMTPRGHYVESVEMQRYFRAMMWIGRTELRLTPPEGAVPPVPDVTREIIDAFLLRELLDSAGGDELERIDELLRALVGDPDNVTRTELDRLAAAVGLDGADDVLDPVTAAAIEAELAAGGYTAQGIVSQILIHDPMDPGGIQLPYAFLLIGQRFVIDSYVTSNVVFDRIVFDGTFPFRGLPHVFDVLFALGNDDVLPFLRDELEAYHYAANLSAVRYLIDGYEPEFWRRSLYTVWLQAIRTLAKTGRTPGVPDFMTTGAWQQQKMNTQLASWTELRHDNLLYAKQSYAGGAVCSFPRTFIEPVPELYRTLEAFAADAAIAFSVVPLGFEVSSFIQPFFESMGATMHALAVIAEKELDGTPFTPEEIDFLSDVIYYPDSCVPTERGWYPELYFGSQDAPASEEDLLIADVHTQPTDAGGAPVGKVLHAATGWPEIGVFVASPPGQPLTAFAGPVAAFHEYVTLDFERLTDEEWADLYETAPPTRPDWTFVYLADENGEIRDGPRLVEDPTPTLESGGETPGGPASAPALYLAPNRPNPFNPTTTLAFRVAGAGVHAVTLRVFDVNGRCVDTLVNDRLGSGTYVVRWDGTDARGEALQSGAYVAELRMGDLAVTHKMVVLR